MGGALSLWPGRLAGFGSFLSTYQPVYIFRHLSHGPFPWSEAFVPCFPRSFVRWPHKTGICADNILVNPSTTTRLSCGPSSEELVRTHRQGGFKRPPNPPYIGAFSSDPCCCPYVVKTHRKHTYAESVSGGLTVPNWKFEYRTIEHFYCFREYAIPNGSNRYFCCFPALVHEASAKVDVIWPMV